MTNFFPVSSPPNVWLVFVLIKMKALTLSRDATNRRKKITEQNLAHSASWAVAQSLLGIAASFIFLNLAADTGLGSTVHYSFSHTNFMMQGRDVWVNLGLFVSCVLSQSALFAFRISHTRETMFKLGPLFWILPFAVIVLTTVALIRQTCLGAEQFSGYIPNSQTFAALLVITSSVAFLGAEIRKNH